MKIDSIGFWVAFGLIGQICFSLRFIVQWIASERKGESVVPETFWYFSIFGSLILLTYAVYRRDPVFIIGQAFGTIVYLRNIMLIRKKKRNVIL